MDARKRTSGLTLRKVSNARFAVAHAARSGLREPKYLLPAPHRLPNRIAFSAGSEAAITELFKHRQANRTRQAKAAKASSFLEGVLVLPAMDDPSTYAGRMAQRLEEWRKAFEQATGCTVLHIAIHLDEGHTDEAGQVHLNTHAHALIDRTLSIGSMWKPNRQELAHVQDLTAHSLGMPRGSTIRQRNGAPARKHIPHQVYRRMKENEAPSPLPGNLRQQNKALSATAEAASTQAKDAGLKAAYSYLRGFLKASGIATQEAYQALKLRNEAKDDAIKAWAKAAELGQMDAHALLLVLAGLDAQSAQEASNATANGCLEGQPAPHLPSDKKPRGLIRWHQQGRDLYLLPERDPVHGRLAFEDKGQSINLRITSDIALMNALALAAMKWPNGFACNGTPEFQAKAGQMAQAMCIKMESTLRSQPRFGL